MDDPLVKLYSKKETTIITSDGKELTFPGSYIMSACVEQYSRSVAKGCVSDQITMVAATYYVDTRTRTIVGDPRFNGGYSMKSLTEKDKANVLRGTNAAATFPEPETTQLIEKIKTFFKSGCRNDYMYIPLKLGPLFLANVPRQVRDATPGHANGILIRRSKGTVMRLEPTYNPFIQEKEIDEGVVKFVNEIGLINPTFVELEHECPQSITGDTNCAFWTMYIFKEILQNIFKKDPNDVIKDIIRGRDREQLSAIIENFKKELVTTIIPSQLSNLGIKSWPDFESAFSSRGGKNGKRKSKFRSTRRKQNGFSIRKTGKARARK